ncbi:MAG: hypothetical protein ACK5AN_17825, partial [Planctomyces sp.]
MVSPTSARNPVRNIVFWLRIRRGRFPSSTEDGSIEAVNRQSLPTRAHKFPSSTEDGSIEAVSQT